MKDKGFTLLELVISVAIVAIIGAVISQTFFVTTRSNTKVEIEKEVKQNGDYALAIMSRMVRSATSLTSTCSASGSATSTLTLTNPDAGTTTFGCGLTSGVTRIASVSALETNYLTNVRATLGGSDCTGSTLTFVCTTVGGVPDSVKVNFTLTQTGSSPDQANRASVSFQTTVSLRNQTPLAP